MCITGSTGWYTNEQKIKIDQFTYRSRPDAKITYIDDDKNGEEVTPKDETLNNLFVRNGEKIDENNTSISNGINYWTNQNYELIDSNWLVNKGSGHYEIHLKHKVNTVSELKTFEEVINYVDQNDNELAPSTTQKITVSRELKHDLVTDKYTEVSHKGTTTFDEVPVNAVITKNGVDYRLDYVDPGYAAGNKSVKANEKSQKAQLPQTGDKKATGLTVFGMLVSLLGMAGLSVSDRFKKLSKAKKSK